MRGQYFCPVCNTPFDEGVKASADYLIILDIRTVVCPASLIML